MVAEIRLRENYKLGKQGHMEKAGVYQHYMDACAERNCRSVMSPTYFGKARETPWAALVKRAFPGIKDVRKGPRGNVKQCYALLKKRDLAKEEKLRLAERLRDLMDHPVDGLARPTPHHNLPEWATAMKTEDDGGLLHHHQLQLLHQHQQHQQHQQQQAQHPHDLSLHHYHQWRRSADAWAPSAFVSGGVPPLPAAEGGGGGGGIRSGLGAKRSPQQAVRGGHSDSGDDDADDDGSPDPQREGNASSQREEDEVSSPGSVGWSSSSPSSSSSVAGVGELPLLGQRRPLPSAAGHPGGNMSISLSMSMPVMGAWGALPPPGTHAHSPTQHNHHMYAPPSAQYPAMHYAPSSSSSHQHQHHHHHPSPPGSGPVPPLPRAFPRFEALGSLVHPFAPSPAFHHPPQSQQRQPSPTLIGLSSSSPHSPLPYTPPQRPFSAPAGYAHYPSATAASTSSLSPSCSSSLSSVRASPTTGVCANCPHPHSPSAPCPSSAPSATASSPLAQQRVTPPELPAGTASYAPSQSSSSPSISYLLDLLDREPHK